MQPAPLPSYAQALERIAALGTRIRRESLPVAQAHRRVLASTVRLTRDQPGFDRATMDGYAVCGSGSSFAVVGTVLAGQLWQGPALRDGECLRIMTGAPCPPGVAVVPIEHTDGGISRMQLKVPSIAVGTNIARRGEDGKAGEVVAAADSTLGAATLAACAMAGHSSVQVYVPPRLALFSTGDELGAAGPAGIADSNGPYLLGFADAMGLPATLTQVPDDEAALEMTLRAGLTSADVLVTSGGVSMGERDLLPALAAKLGLRTVLHGVNLQPGKPVFVAINDAGQALVGLPGNPVSVLATAHLVLLPMLRLWVPGLGPNWIERPLAHAHANPGKRHQFLPARIEASGVHIVPWNGSGDLLAAASADALADLAPGGSWQAGQTMRVLPFVDARYDGGGRSSMPAGLRRVTF